MVNHSVFDIPTDPARLEQISDIQEVQTILDALVHIDREDRHLWMDRYLGDSWDELALVYRRDRRTLKKLVASISLEIRGYLMG